MYLDGASYGNWKFDPVTLEARVITVAAGVRHLMEELSADCIAVRGTSGICMAWALNGSGCDFPIVLMRKAGESSHGSMFEGRSGHIHRRVIILDDFIASGATVGGMVRDIKAHSKLMGDNVEVVGLLLHQYAEARYESAMRRRMGIPLPAKSRNFVCEDAEFPMYTYEEAWR